MFGIHCGESTPIWHRRTSEGTKLSGASTCEGVVIDKSVAALLKKIHFILNKLGLKKERQLQHFCSPTTQSRHFYYFSL